MTLQVHGDLTGVMRITSVEKISRSLPDHLVVMVIDVQHVLSASLRQETPYGKYKTSFCFC